MKIVIASTVPSQADAIHQTLKFFPIPAKHRVEVISPLNPEQLESESDLGIENPPQFHTIAGDIAPLELSQLLNGLQPDILIVGDNHLARSLIEVNNANKQCLYIDDRLSYLYLASDTELKCDWLMTRPLSFATLESDAKYLPHIETTYANSADWSIAERSDNEILLTQNAELVDYLSLTSAKYCQVYPLGFDYPCLNLSLNRLNENDYHERIHRVLMSAIDIADCGAKVDLPRLRQLRNMQHGSSAYAAFAKDYDDYMSHVDYDLWLKLLLQWHKRYSDLKLKRILEIACGTANVSGLLIFDGYDVDACDSSWQMLSMADQKVFKPRLFIRTMTEPLPKLNYDLILCLFDSINYLQKDDEIRVLLDNAYAALAEGGLFIFDISTILNSRDNFADTFNLTHKKDTYMFHHAEYDEFTAKQKSHLYYFTKEHGSYRSEIERHVQRVYRHQEMIRLINRSKFDLVGIHCTESPRNLLPKAHTDLDEQFPRLFFVLKKQAD